MTFPQMLAANKHLRSEEEKRKQQQTDAIAAAVAMAVLSSSYSMHWNATWLPNTLYPFRNSPVQFKISISPSRCPPSCHSSFATNLKMSILFHFISLHRRHLLLFIIIVIISYYIVLRCTYIYICAAITHLHGPQPQNLWAMHQIVRHLCNVKIGMESVNALVRRCANVRMK